MADHHCRPGGKEFEVLQNVPDADRNSLAYVTFGTKEGRENCVEVDPDHAVTLFYRDAVCNAGRSQTEEYVVQKPTTWVPKCIIALIEADSRAKMRDELIEAGRVLTDPFLVSFNFTTALAADPDVATARGAATCWRDFARAADASRLPPPAPRAVATPGGPDRRAAPSSSSWAG